MKKILLILLTIIGYIPESFGCTCWTVNSITQEFRKKELVLVGKMISKQQILIIDSVRLKQYLADGKKVEESLIKRVFGKRYIENKFVISKVYKGEVDKDTISVYTISNSCGINFISGEKYIIYGRSSSLESNFKNSGEFPYKYYPSGKNLIWTHYCHRTKLYKKNEAKKLARLSKKLITTAK